MRILTVSNFYPPHHIGGYELRCEDVVHGLRDRGHDVSVLTSKHGLRRPETTAGVHRQLHLGGLSTLPGGGLLGAAMVEYLDHRTLNAMICRFNPQLISIWNLAGLADTLLTTIQQLKIPAVYDISDDWLIKKLHKNVWRRKSPRRSRRVGKTLLRLLLKLGLPYSILPSPDDFELHACYFTSKALKELYLSWGFPLATAPVIYCGIPLDRYISRERKDLNSPIKLLFVGQLEKQKGTHTALQALAELVNCTGVKSATLTIAGTGRDQDYDRLLRDFVVGANLRDRVQFLGRVPRDAMPRIYDSHDILIFPSIVEEAFSLTLLEAMASGLAVVATATGGSKEILIDEWNSLIFRPEDADQLTTQLERLIASDELRQYLSQNALKTVRPRFDITYMVDQIEEVFKDAISESMMGLAL